MLSKLSIITLLAAATFASALPADSQNSVSKRQEEWNIWNLNLYESGCDDEPTENFSGHDDQQFACAGSVMGWHNVKMENLAATGHKVLLYSDGGCLNQIGEVLTDDLCYSAPTDTVISGYGIVLV